MNPPAQGSTAGVLGTRQFPVDPNDANTGQNGLLVYFDPAPRVDANPGTRAALSTLDGKQSLGAIQFTTAQRRGLRVSATLQNVPRGAAVVNIPTSVGNETAPCTVNSDGSAFCDGPLLGAPMKGAPVLLGVDGAPVGRGVIQ